MPISSEHFRLTIDIPNATCDKLQSATDLLRHTLPDGDVAAVLDRALTALLRDLARSKYAATNTPRMPRDVAAGSRSIPASVRRGVWQRDAGRCAFVGTRGRCRATAFLEFHHLTPFAVGGQATVENIELRCAAHNRREAELFFGAGMSSLVRETPAVYGELGLDLVDARPLLPPPRA